MPSLRSATPFAVPLSKSSKEDWRHQRVCSARTGTVASRTPATAIARTFAMIDDFAPRNSRPRGNVIRMRLLRGRRCAPPARLLDSDRNGRRSLNDLFERHGTFSGRRLPHHERAGWAATLVEEIDLRCGHDGHHFVLHHHGRRWPKQRDVKPVVAPLAVQHRYKLLQILQASLRSGYDVHAVQRA